jgi:hypothetical protein
LWRSREGYEKFGNFGSLDRRRDQPSPKRVPMATVEKVLALPSQLISENHRRIPGAAQIYARLPD